MKKKKKKRERPKNRLIDIIENDLRKADMSKVKVGDKALWRTRVVNFKKIELINTIGLR